MATKEEFLAAGYVHIGYFSPPLSTEDTYPEYIKENVEAALARIKKVADEKSVSFAFMTDIHYSKTPNHDVRFQRLMNAYRTLKENIGADKILIGGDVVNDGTKKYKRDNQRELAHLLSGEKFFPANGNHDDNSIWDTVTETAPAVNHLTSGELYSLFYSHLPELGAKFADEGESLYYYYDDNDEKIRYIFLDMCDAPQDRDSEGRIIHTKQTTYAFSQKQIDWLISDALNVREEGFGAVITMHSFFREEDGESKRLTVVRDILDACKTGGKISKTYYEGEFAVSVNVDFGTRPHPDIIAVLAGHHHKDMGVYTESKIPVIFTGNVMMYDYAVPRIDGTPSELLFDVVTIDRKKRKIYTTRIGAGDHREFDY